MYRCATSKVLLGTVEQCNAIAKRNVAKLFATRQAKFCIAAFSCAKGKEKKGGRKQSIAGNGGVKLCNSEVKLG